MSEYQYYEFRAIDRPLDPDQLREVRALSTRAEITPTSFVNVYHFGSFRGDPRRLMEEYYDAFLYSASWGTYRLTTRLPADLLDLATAQQYCRTDSASAWSHGGNVIIDLYRNFEDGDYWGDEGGEGHLASMIPARAQLAAGDLRMLYLGWLLLVESDELDDDEPEPPVPPNLSALNGPLRSLVEFLRLDEDLLAVAAEASPRQPATQPSESQWASWVATLPAAEKDALLLRVLRDDAAHLRTELLRRFHRQPEPVTVAGAGRTVAELREAAQARSQERERLAAQQRERERLQRKREDAAARTRHLDALEQQGEQPWRRVTSLIDTKQTREYDAAVALLGDLRELSQRQGRTDEFTQRVRQLRQQYARRPGLLDRLNHAGLTS
ncbi:MAG: hypothetical protein ACRDT2_06975 [Natronosporangium sp.]